jgi:SAM-dependent methyltransferase
VGDELTIARAFERAGFAALGDLRAHGYDALFAQLAEVQDDFAAAVPVFRHPGYHWGTDPLHTWGRAWEYPFAYYHLARERARRAERFAVADFGSGSTFFPFAVARLGAEVVCLDNDPMCVRDLAGAIAELDAGTGRVEVRESGNELPCPTAGFDAVYSVSVLEHMPDPVPVVAEIARILRPGGLFVLTLDIDVEGVTGVAAAHFDALRADIERAFTWEYAERTLHPSHVLTSRNSPWPRPGEAHVPGLLYRTKDRRLVPLVGGPNPGVLTVYGCVLRRRA